MLDPECRNAARGRSYENVLLVRLQEARRQGAEVEEGLTAILNDLIATVCGRTTVHSGYYVRLAERGVIERGVAEAM
jgi:hypothetical protein